MLGCEDLRNHQPHSGYIWEHSLRVYRAGGRGWTGQDISKETRKTLSCSAPHSQACFLTLSSLRLPSLSFLECAPLPHAVHQHAGAETGLCSFPLRASSPATSLMACHLSGTLSGRLPPSVLRLSFKQGWHAHPVCPGGHVRV